MKCRKYSWLKLTYWKMEGSQKRLALTLALVKKMPRDLFTRVTRRLQHSYLSWLLMCSITPHLNFHLWCLELLFSLWTFYSPSISTGFERPQDSLPIMGQPNILKEVIHEICSLSMSSKIQVMSCFKIRKSILKLHILLHGA